MSQTFLSNVATINQIIFKRKNPHKIACSWSKLSENALTESYIF